jgi:ribA/ribD-fused uncharacterized protein
LSRKRKNKEDFCSICKVQGHRQLSDSCQSKQAPPLSNVTAFKGQYDVFSNFYPCDVFLWGLWFVSTEQAYQYRKAVKCEYPNIARRILGLTNSREIKILSNEIATTEQWDDKKVELFRQILAAKALYCPEYTHALLTAQEVIAEAVPGDLFWSTGLSKQELYHCKMERWPGYNQMGKLHMELRETLLGRLQCDDSEFKTVPTLRDLCGGQGHVCYCKVHR